MHSAGADEELLPLPDEDELLLDEDELLLDEDELLLDEDEGELLEDDDDELLLDEDELLLDEDELLLDEDEGELLEDDDDELLLDEDEPQQQSCPAPRSPPSTMIAPALSTSVIACGFYLKSTTWFRRTRDFH